MHSSGEDNSPHIDTSRTPPHDTSTSPSHDTYIQVGVTSFVSSAGCESGNPHGFSRVAEHLEVEELIMFISFFLFAKPSDKTAIS